MMRVGPRSPQPKKAHLAAAVLGCALCAGLVFQVACGGGSSTKPGTPAGMYTINVNGTDASGALVHSTHTMLTVQ